jgi:hypothetical protein
MKHYYDPQYLTELEHEDREAYWSSIAEWDVLEAEALGRENPERPWILTGNDVWHVNPYYTGHIPPHPEASEEEHDAYNFIGPKKPSIFDDEIPF